MEIRKSTMEDFERLMELFADAREYMAENGNPDQWKTTWPPQELILSDIKNGTGYVCVDGEKIVGTFFFDIGPDPTYIEIHEGSWIQEDRPYGVVHRITTDRHTRGAGAFCLAWALEQAGNIRIDTHKDNIPMQGLMKKMDFTYCGIIYLENGEERIAFQKVKCDTEGSL